jgi:hypothetical protein
MKNELAHVGVLGMRWGRRSNSLKRTQSPEHSQVKELKKKKASELTNNELKIVSERIRLEKQYNELNPSSISRGKKSVESAFSTLGKVATASATVISLIEVGKKIMTMVEEKRA